MAPSGERCRLMRTQGALVRLAHAPFSPSHSGWPSSPSGMKFCHKILETLGYHMVKTRSLYLTWFWNGIGSWHQDRQTDWWTDRITIA